MKPSRRVRRTAQSTSIRFAVVSLVPMVALGVVLSSALRTSIESRTAAVYTSTTTVMFNMAADVIARPEDFTSGDPLPPERVAIVDELLKRLGVDRDRVRVRFVAPDRQLIYAHPAAETAVQPDSDRLQAALQGEAGTEIVRATGEGDSANRVEMYLPVRFSGDPTVHGAVIASGIDTDMIEMIESDVRRMRGSLALGLGVLWLALLPISSSVSRRLRRTSAENEYLALHDTLTGLPNRNLLADRLEHAITMTSRTGKEVGLLLIDLDHFKEVNDTLGHGKGDELLERVASQLAGAVRAGDTVARLGGDEFAVVVTDLEHPDELHAIAARVEAALAGAIAIDCVDVDVRGSIGGAIYPTLAASAEELLRHADIAMYAAKASRDDFVLYRPEIDLHSPSRLALAADLRRALQDPSCDGQILLHYQPVACPASGDVRAMEALVRWEHPTRGLLPPVEFVPMAEQSGLIRRLTSKVLDLAVAQARAWEDEGLDLSVAVNLSATDLRSEALTDEVAATLARHNLSPDRLELEVTETAILAHPEAAVQVVAGLQRLGIPIALDDFGTGYSSLTYLKRLHPDRLKIDRTFVDAMTHEETDAQIVQSVIELAHNLAIGVTAEGVETQEHWDLLRELACDLVQGYYLARPMPPNDVTAWLQERSRAANAPQTSQVG